MHRCSFEIRRFPFAFTLAHMLKILRFWSWWMSIRAARRQANHAAMRIRASRRQTDPPCPLARGHRFCGGLPIIRRIFDGPYPFAPMRFRVGLAFPALDRCDEAIIPAPSVYGRLLLDVERHLRDASARTKHDRKATCLKAQMALV